ncbi:hypothetical protein MHM84_18715 [Halomonas sp. McH1-25]|uniref:hypothetical protein n=1 Tax=unclassified Halomonas TaxID=2609666 RepID=UPI001EF71C6F|nr:MULTISPECIES: hypothetical protein [unclassified Halomonas]MCG7601800.1 hypothetical protein [Halomonas sp. McH1-25]MCP1343976.1 hypothetical protein [Halomonas sp. FL8]MCP1361791.1 hypothetical protein [Halomonas sp. BBD45]MCP1364935.1 hypothetical protein [Halomonas sp. BBD48]
MNPFKGSRAFLFAVLIPIMLPQVLPEPLLWIWLTLVVLWALKRLGIIKIGFDPNLQSDDDPASSPGSSEREGSAHQGKIVALGSAPYQFDEANSLSYYITLRSGRGNDKTLWGVDLRRVARETSLAVDDTVALEFLGRQAVVVQKPIRDDQGRIVDHQKINTHRYSWSAKVLSA